MPFVDRLRGAGDKLKIRPQLGEQNRGALSVEVLDQPVVRKDLDLVVGEGDGEEVLGAAGVGARGMRRVAGRNLGAGAPGRGGAVVAVGDVELGNPRERGDQSVPVGARGAPDGMRDAVGGGEVEQGLSSGHLRHDVVYLC